MADKRGVRRIGLAFIQQGFQPSRGTVEKEGFDSVGHVSFLPQHSAFSVQQSAKNKSTAKGAKDAKS